MKLCVHFSDPVKYEIYDPIDNSTFWFLLNNGNVSASPRYPNAHRVSIVFSASQFDAKSWLKHILYTINPSEIESLSFFRTAQEFNERQFQMHEDCLKGLSISVLMFENMNQMQHIVKIVNAFMPTRQLAFLGGSQDTFTSSELLAFRQVLCQETLHRFFEMHVPLNELLFTNCSRISTTILTEKEINMFLKHWIAGFKPELEYFSIPKQGTHFNQDIILEGIQYETAPIERKVRILNKYTRGGADIQMSHESKVTIIFDFIFAFNYSMIYVAVHGSKYISFNY